MGPEHFGVVFRSTSHYGWFLLSAFCFVAIVAWNVLGVFYLAWRKRLNDGYPAVLAFPSIFMTLFHVSTSLGAVIFTRFGQINGPIYSVDCIWFNLLMAVLYLFMFWVTNKVLQNRDAHNKSRFRSLEDQS